MTARRSLGGRRPLSRGGVAGVIAFAIAAAGLLWLLFAFFVDRGELLIMPETDGVTGGVQEGDTVRVTGIVRDFEFQPRYGEANELEAYDERNAVFATRVEIVDEESSDGGMGFDEIAVDPDLEGEQVTIVGEVTDDAVGALAILMGET